MNQVLIVALFWIFYLFGIEWLTQIKLLEVWLLWNVSKVYVTLKKFMNENHKIQLNFPV